MPSNDVLKCPLCGGDLGLLYVVYLEDGSLEFVCEKCWKYVFFEDPYNKRLDIKTNLKTQESL